MNKPKDLGVSVSDGVGTKEEIGPGQKAFAPPMVEFNAVALVVMDKNHNIDIKQVSYLTEDKRIRRARMGEVIPFSVKVGAK